MGVCACACLRVCRCVRARPHLVPATNVHCTARASPMITGIHSAQKQPAYRTQCNCNQSVTKLRANGRQTLKVGPMRTTMMVMMVAVAMMKEAAKGQARGGTLASRAHFVMLLFYFYVCVSFNVFVLFGFHWPELRSRPRRHVCLGGKKRNLK